MDFAADAVFDAVAPPPTRSANARPTATTDKSERTFDDHLDAASSEEAPPEAPAVESDKPETSDKSVAGVDPAEAQLPAASPQQAPQPSPQFVIQLVAPEVDASATQVNDTTVAPEMAAAGPAQPQPAAPPVQPSSQPAQADDAPVDAAASAGAAPKPDHAQQKSTRDAPKADASADTLDTPPQAQMPTARPTAPAPATSVPISAEAVEAISAIATQPTQTTPVTRDAQPRTAKSELRLGVDAEAAPEANAAASQPPAARAAPKLAQTQSNSDASVPAAAPAIDAPDTLPPAPQQLTGITTSPAAQTQHATLEHNVARTVPAAAQVAREIVRQFDGENTRFELRLDPPELGRVEVRLEVSRDHRVTAVIAADSPQALNELSRHARDLEQMLQSSGLELTDNGLSFDLRQGGEGSRDTSDTSPNVRGAASEDIAQHQTTTARPLGYERWRGVRVDVMV